MALATEPQTDQRTSWLKAMGRVLFFPEDTFRLLYGRSNFLGPALVQTVVYILAGLLLLGPTERLAYATLARVATNLSPQAMALQKQMIQIMIPVGLMVLAPILLWVRWTVVSLVFYLVGLTVDRETGFGKWYSVAVYASIPGLFAYVLGAVLMNLGSANAASAQTPATLFSLAVFLHGAVIQTWGGQFLSQVNPFTLWYLALASVGFAVYAGVSRNRGSFIVLGLWVLEAMSLAIVGAAGATLSHLGGA